MNITNELRCVRRNTSPVYGLLILFAILMGSAISSDTFANNTSDDNATAEQSTANIAPARRRVAQILSMPGSNAIVEARKFLEEEAYQAAIDTLVTVVDGERFSEFDKAKALQLIAYAYIALEDYPAAINANKQALSSGVLDEDSETDILYAQINLSSAVQNYPQAVSYLKIWLSRIGEPHTQALFTAAHIYALAENYTTALEYSEQALQKHRAQQATVNTSNNEEQNDLAPKESWYRIHLAILLQLKRYPDTVALLQEMLGFWPDNENYYSQLGGIYLELDNPSAALSVLSIAYKNQLLSSEQDINRIAQLYRFQNYPFKAVTLLETTFAKDTADGRDDDEWKSLGDTYWQARHWQDAKTAYLKAAELSEQGKYWLLLCQTTYRENLWDEASQYCKNALDKGGLENAAGDAWQILAMSDYQRNNLTAAIASFERCQAWQNTEKTCTQWVQHINHRISAEADEQTRLEEQAAEEERLQQQREQRLERALMF